MYIQEQFIVWHSFPPKWLNLTCSNWSISTSRLTFPTKSLVYFFLGFAIHHTMYVFTIVIVILSQSYYLRLLTLLFLFVFPLFSIIWNCFIKSEIPISVRWWHDLVALIVNFEVINCDFSLSGACCSLYSSSPKWLCITAWHELIRYICVETPWFAASLDDSSTQLSNQLEHFLLVTFVAHNPCRRNVPDARNKYCRQQLLWSATCSESFQFAGQQCNAQGSITLKW